MEKVKKINLRIMSKQYAHLHTMAKISVKFQNDWPKIVGGVALTRHPLYIVDERTNRQITACLYRPTQVGQQSTDASTITACRSMSMLSKTRQKTQQYLHYFYILNSFINELTNNCIYGKSHLSGT